VGWVVPRLHEIDGNEAQPGQAPGISLSYGFAF
jgi:hypothetical protein